MTVARIPKITPGPNFLCIGPHKTATTWLQAMLGAMPGCFLPAIKETHYFVERIPSRKSEAARFRLHQCEHMRLLCERQASRDRCRRLAPEFTHCSAEEVNDAWYRGVFSFAGEGQVRGEICPSYFDLPETSIDHVLGINPEIRIVIMVRDPVDRAWSHIRMNQAYGLNTGTLSLDSVSDAALERCARSANYARVIPMWESRATPARVGVFPFDEVITGPWSLLERIAGFVGIAAKDVDLDGEIDAVLNPGPEQPLPAKTRQRLLELLGEQYTYLGGLFPDLVEQWLRRHGEAIGRASGIGQVARGGL